jgi:hypothetical protein
MLYVFWAVSPPIIRSSKFKTVRTTSGICPASSSSKQTGHIPDVVCTVLNFELLMMGRETARNMSKMSIDTNKEYCIALHLFDYT